MMSKGALDHMPPMTLLALQLTASITVLWLAVLVLRLRVRLDGPTRTASLSGLLEPGLAYTFGVIGLALTTASNAALIGAAEPIFILVLAWLMLGERFARSMWAPATCAAIGIVLVVMPDAAAVSGQGSLLGDLFVGLGALLAALYVIATRRLVVRMNPLTLSALQQSVGLLWALGALLVTLAFGMQQLGLESVSREGLILAIVSGIVQYALAFWLYLFALQRLPANVAGFFLTLIPVFGMGAAFVFLGESLTVLQWFGAIAIVLSVATIARMGRTP